MSNLRVEHRGPLSAGATGGRQSPNQFKGFGTRLLRLIAVNVLAGLAVTMLLSAFAVHHGQNVLATEIETSLLHSIIYGLSFGLSAPYIAQRLELMASPWNWIFALFSIAVIAVLSTFAVQSSLLVFGFAGTEAFRMIFIYKTATVSVLAVVIGLSVYTYESIRTQIHRTNLQLRTQELERERTVKLLTEARLASLESRLHPHFLFNTLNSISALILEDPLVADEMVQRLARLLRASLDACEQDRVTLEQELELAVDYLNIEQARFRERLSYSVDVPGDLMSLSIPPIILQPLVENSVKFAVAPSLSGASIKISARRNVDGIELEVWDNGPGFTVDMIRPGHGLDNLQSRLSVILGETSHLQVVSEKGTAVRVQLPIDPSKEK